MVTPYVKCLTVMLAAVVSLFIFGKYRIFEDDEYFHVIVNSKEVLCETDEKFLSVALDMSFMRCFFHKFTDEDWSQLEKLTSLLSPAYLRVGGTDADRTVFSLNTVVDREIFTNLTCNDFVPRRKIIITGEDWLKLNKFAERTNLSLIIDLNVLYRKNSMWDDSNAKALLKFSEKHGLRLDFQLGNEPNSFPHVFHTTITGSQLAKDFQKLKELLNSTEAYRGSKLIGPDITKPKLLGSSSLKFLEEFLSKGDVVDVVSWHQYYLNGHIATLKDFIDPSTFNLLPLQIQAILKTVRLYSPNKPVWLSETGSAYGSGAPGLSNTFAGSFLWLDKLGLSARSNISTVIRQSLFLGHYAMIGDNFSVNPDFWISLLYKQLVGTRVLDVKIQKKSTIFFRCYAHCVGSNSRVNGNMVLYGFNLSNETALFVPFGMSIVYPVYSYIFNTENNNLISGTVFLNNQPLFYRQNVIQHMLDLAQKVKYPLRLPPYSIGLWVIKAKETACKR